MTKYQYRVCGWRYCHTNSPTCWFHVVALPDWLARYFKREPKKAKKHWTIERLYRRVKK